MAVYPHAGASFDPLTGSAAETVTGTVFTFPGAEHRDGINPGKISSRYSPRYRISFWFSKSREIGLVR